MTTRTGKGPLWVQLEAAVPDVHIARLNAAKALAALELAAKLNRRGTSKANAERVRRAARSANEAATAAKRVLPDTERPAAVHRQADHVVWGPWEPDPDVVEALHDALAVLAGALLDPSEGEN